MRYLYIFLLFSIHYYLIADKDNYSEKNEFTGMVVPIITSTLEYPYDDEMPGNIIYTAAPGTILKGATYSADGTLVKKGDYLLEYKSSRREHIYKEKIQELKNSEADLKFATDDIVRYNKLMNVGFNLNGNNKNIVKKSDYELAYSNYLKAKAVVEKAKIQVLRAKSWLDLTSEHAYFDCIVTDVYNPLGLCAFEDKIMTVAQINPIGIKINLSREEIYNFPDNIPIKIYPFSSDKYIETYGFNKIIKDDGIILRIRNNPLLPEIPDKYKNLRCVNTAWPVECFDDNSINVSLSVPKSCINKNEKGEFVWKASVNNELDPKINKRILLFDINRVYITTCDEQRYINPHKIYIKLKNTDGLTDKDYVLEAEDLKDNINEKDQVIFFKKRYIFTPGDTVKIRY